MNRRTIIFIVAIIIMIIGAVIANVMGFNKGIEYGGYTRILIYMNTESNLDDIKSIFSEIFDGKYSIAYTDGFKDTVSIKAQGITEEQIDILENKINEKYKYDEEDTDYMVTINTASVGTLELIKDYIKPIVISFILALIYFAFAYRKQGLIDGLIIPAASIVIINSLYISIIAICRISLNSFIIPIGVFIYILSLLGTAAYLNGKKSE